MTVRGSYKVTGSPERVYDLLQDATVLQRAIPGCEQLTELGNGRYAMNMKVALAALAGDFSGNVQLADGERPKQFRMTVDGTGRLGFLRGDGLLTLTPEAESTVVSYEGTAHIGGTMASVGQRLLDATAKMMIRMFFERLGRCAAEVDGAAR